MSAGRRRRNARARAAAAFGCMGGVALFAGCTVGPDFRRPDPPPVSVYTATPQAAVTAASPGQFGTAQRLAPGEVAERWWLELGSSELNALIDQALQSSPTLEQARATLRKAEHVFRAQAGSSLYPQIDADVGAQRQRVNTSAFGLAEGERTFGLFNAGVKVAYTLDLFGGNRRALESLAAQAEHQRFQLEGARLALAGNVVTTTIRQAQLATQIMATQNILRAQEAQLELTQKRNALGSASVQEVLSLRTQLEQTRAQIPALRLRLEQTNHLLATLIGQPPGAAVLPQFTLDDFTLPTELPVRVPSQLARRRPDIRASEALVHAATADYGVAVARLFPQLSLAASGAEQSLSTASLFDSGSLVWGLAAGLTQPLFNAGLSAEKEAARAGIDAAAAHYRETVLAALRDVADVLRALEYDAQALAALAAADAAARGSLQSLHAQYSLGAASHLDLLIAQQQVLRTRIDLISAQSQRLIDTAALYQSMGGGWSDNPGHAGG